MKSIRNVPDDYDSYRNDPRHPDYQEPPTAEEREAMEDAALDQYLASLFDGVDIDP